MHETAAAAAIFNKQIAKWLIETDPEIIGKSYIPDTNLRRKAAIKFLDLFRSGKYTDANIYHDQNSLIGFKYLRAAKDLRKVLEERSNGIEDCQACAIEMVTQWRLTELSNLLAQMVLDRHLPLHTRLEAGYSSIMGYVRSERA